MAEADLPQIYLVTPAAFDPEAFVDPLGRVLDSHPVACVRLALATRDEDDIARAADACRAVCHERDVALVIDTHLRLVSRHGLDGVHLHGARGIRDARKELGEDAIVGAFCGHSRHDGMNAGEAGADYIAFGPVSGAGLGDGALADRELFAWWSEMIELPVVAEGGLDPETIASLATVTDFFAFGEEIWRTEDPAAELARLMSSLG